MQTFWKRAFVSKVDMFQSPFPQLSFILLKEKNPKYLWTQSGALILALCTKEINSCVKSQSTKQAGTRRTEWLGRMNQRTDKSGSHQFSLEVERLSWKPIQKAAACLETVLQLRWCNLSLQCQPYTWAVKWPSEASKLSLFWADINALFMH